MRIKKLTRMQKLGATSMKHKEDNPFLVFDPLSISSSDKKKLVLHIPSTDITNFPEKDRHLNESILDQAAKNAEIRHQQESGSEIETKNSNQKDKKKVLLSVKKRPDHGNEENNALVNIYISESGERNKKTDTAVTINEGETTLSANASSNSSDEDNSEYEVSSTVKDEINALVESFPTLSNKYKLLDKIGEGTFSTVYKAEVLTNIFDNEFQNIYPEKDNKLIPSSNSATKKQCRPVVALKRIYVTSSPQRIYNELVLLYNLDGCPNVAPLLDALRYEDQVIAVLPFYKHADFRDFYRDLPLSGIKIYMFELLTALKFIHGQKVIHRDIKPTNFLYNPFTRKGVLVDFGLAEKEVEPEANCCICAFGGIANDDIPQTTLLNKGYLKEDQRPGRRANRAGTRGFRAPEVLFKCNNQTTKLDMWSAGVMLLTLLARRFPFFNSTDDIDGIMEMTNIFGINSMKKCAQLHGLGFDCNIQKFESGISLGALLIYAVTIDCREGDTFAEDSPAWELLSAFDKKGNPFNTELGREYSDALEVLELCMKLDFNERIDANEALKLDFFKEIQEST